MELKLTFTSYGTQCSILSFSVGLWREPSLSSLLANPSARTNLSYLLNLPLCHPPPPERLVQYVLALPQTMNTAACRMVSSFPGVPPAAQPPQENGLQMQEPAVISLPRALDGLRPSEKSSGPSSPVPATSPVPSGTSHLCPHQIKPLVGSAKRLHSAGSPHACCGAFSLKYRFHSLSSFEAPPNWDAASVGHCVWIPPDWLRAPGRKRGHLSVTGAKPTTWHRASRCELFVGLNHYLIPSPCLFFFERIINFWIAFLLLLFPLLHLTQG